MSADSLWPAALPVNEHLGRVRQWGGPRRWLAALDRAEEILVPRFEGKWDNGWNMQDASSGIALLIYLVAGNKLPSEPSAVTERDIINAYPHETAQTCFGVRLDDLFEKALIRLGHNTKDMDSTDPIVMTWHNVLMARHAPLGHVPDDVASDFRVGTVLQSGLPCLITELRTPGALLVPSKRDSQ